ncbi:MAG TPA: trypsin-like peptidase domain-containing protein [Jatrophihabitans sp.]|nr:trypsin-like peptidase domain-containing protein [Jatrophihabitans sp.]
MRLTHWLVTSVSVAVTLTLTTAASASNAPPNTPSAVAAPATALVGPLFSAGLARQHTCTASVLDSPGHDLILTAAHCVSGNGTGILFAPGYDRGATPYGVWTSVAAYVDPSWISDQDPQHDVAILRLARRQVPGGSVGVADVTRVAEAIAPAPRPGEQLSVPSYPAGIEDQPISCNVSAYYFGKYPSFNCAGYVGGTSGAPWLARIGHSWVVTGVIGGLHQGGCVDYTSYSSAFGLDTYRLWLRAAFHQPADTVPVAGPDGC